MSLDRDRKFLDLFDLMVGILVGLFAGVMLLTSYLVSSWSVAIVGSLIFMVLWNLAWRSRPRLAFGIFLGVAGACELVPIVRFSGIRRVPIWLPALPITVVAITLFGFGVLAWRWGKNE